MEGDPFALIEGMAIAGFAVGATKGYVYTRSEYPHAIATFNAALAIARREGLLGATCSAPTRRSTSSNASAPAPMSAARKPRCWTAWRASAARCAPSRRCRRTRACSASRRWSTTSSRWPACRSSWREGAEAYQSIGFGRSRGTMPIQLAGNVQLRRLVRGRLRRDAGRTGERYRRRHAVRPSGARGAGRRAARRLFPAGAVRHARSTTRRSPRATG